MALIHPGKLDPAIAAFFRLLNSAAVRASLTPKSATKVCIKKYSLYWHVATGYNWLNSQPKWYTIGLNVNPGLTPPINKPWFINPGLTLYFNLMSMIFDWPQGGCTTRFFLVVHPSLVWHLCPLGSPANSQFFLVVYVVPTLFSLDWGKGKILTGKPH